MNEYIYVIWEQGGNYGYGGSIIGAHTTEEGARKAIENTEYRYCTIEKVKINSRNCNNL